MQGRKNKIAAVVIAAGLLMGLSACTDAEPEDEKYVSPTFNTEVVTRGDDGKPIEKSTEKVEAEKSELSTAEAIEGKDLETDLSTSTTIAGTYENGNYYNPFVGLAIQSDDIWRFYDAPGVAEATGLTEDEVNDLWYGVVSPHSVKTMTCCIAYKKDTGSNLIISYINPKLYYMQNMTAREYLELSSRSVKGAEVRNVEYLGQVYATVELPEEKEGTGKRVQFAMRKDDLIVLLTYTLQGEDTIEEAADHVTRLIVP